MYKSLPLTLAAILTISACQSTPFYGTSATYQDNPESSAGLRELIRLQISEGNIERAEQMLAGIESYTTEDYFLLADICTARRQFRCAADALIQASLAQGLSRRTSPESYPDQTSPSTNRRTPAAIGDDLHDRIWSALSRARSGPDAYTHRYHLAWWQLQQNIREASSLTAQIAAWQTWTASNPSHPAALRPPSALTQLNNYQAPNIAVLLPLSGRLATAGRAVQDAFAAAYLEENETSSTHVRFYDTEAQSLGQLWEQVLQSNANVVVGPLIKNRAEAFIELTENSPLPRLVLNYVDTEVDPASTQVQLQPAGPLYQFGIAIEDEATSLAQIVLSHGHERIAIVHGDATWANRAASAYQASWAYPATTASFKETKDLTRAVGQAMQVAESEARRNEIANIVGQNLEFLPRGRQDLEAIVALTNNVESRALIPALRFHFGDHLPIYATSQAARRGDVANLKGFYLSEMPLFAEGEKFSELADGFSLRGNPLAELYALGYDAYRVATWLPALNPQSSASLQGASGYLWLDADGIFRRELSLTQVSTEGALEPVHLDH